MKTLGIVLIIAGCILGGYAYQMNTTIKTESKDFGYGISIPSMEVNNIGLIEDRKNKLMIAGVLVVIGSIFTALGITQEAKASELKNTSDHMKCPFCAELIKSEAVICRYCGKDIPLNHNKEVANKIPIAHAI